MVRRSLVGKIVKFRSNDIRDQYEDFIPDNPFSVHFGTIISDVPRQDYLTVKLVKPIEYVKKIGTFTHDKKIVTVNLSSKEVEVVKIQGENSNNK